MVSRSDALGREHIGAARQIFLDDVVLRRALQRGARRALLVGDGDIERHQPAGGGVDRHRGVHGRDGDAVEQRAHVADMRDRDADLADLAARQRMVAVVADLGRQVEGDGEPGLALGEIGAVELVGLARRWNGRRRCGKSRVCRVRPSRSLVRSVLCRAQSQKSAAAGYRPFGAPEAEALSDKRLRTKATQVSMRMVTAKIVEIVRIRVVKMRLVGAQVVEAHVKADPDSREHVERVEVGPEPLPLHDVVEEEAGTS